MKQLILTISITGLALVISITSIAFNIRLNADRIVDAINSKCMCGK